MREVLKQKSSRWRVDWWSEGRKRKREKRSRKSTETSASNGFMMFRLMSSKLANRIASIRNRDDRKRENRIENPKLSSSHELRTRSVVS